MYKGDKQVKTAFVNPNIGSEYPRPPLGLLSLATICRQAGYDAEIIDANLLRFTDGDLIKQVQGCDVVGFTAMTPVFPEAKRLSKLIKESCGAFTMLGGPHASAVPQIDGFDIVVVGEGEDAMLEILKLVDSKDCPGEQPGGIILGAGLKPNEIPLPDYSLIDIDSYKPRPPHGTNGKWTAVVTSRGCPYECLFCSKCVFGNVFRPLSAKRVVSLLETLVCGNDVKDITFYDDIFTLSESRVVDICLGILKNELNITWSCESRVNLADADILLMMKDAGCRMIYYGIESGSQRILDNLCKNVTLEQIKRAVHLTKEVGIKVAGYFMLGAPGETQQTIEQTLRFARGVGLDHVQFSVCVPMPGTVLYERYIAEGNDVPDWTNFQYLADVEKPMFINGDCSREYIEKAVRDANDEWTIE